MCLSITLCSRVAFTDDIPASLLRCVSLHTVMSLCSREIFTDYIQGPYFLLELPSLHRCVSGWLCVCVCGVSALITHNTSSSYCYVITVPTDIGRVVPEEDQQKTRHCTDCDNDVDHGPFFDLVGPALEGNGVG